ncbi:MAG TPA: alpha/beta hydrolase fold domain-containing protein, partial [Verrucomicrobiae bacterium]|nr:alpha/beta hydrolase fold domain-containing protein [Verrucomicrobiae bacterium]
AWIDHLVKRGNMVVYPLYQDSLRTPLGDFTPNAIAATRAAIRTLEEQPDHVRPQLDKVAVAGHSMGGVISANMAALWKSENLPALRAVMCVEPGKTWGNATRAKAILADLSKIPAKTLLLTVVGDKDHVVRDIDARRIFLESVQVPPSNKNYIELVSDDHGSPTLTANHFAPAAWAELPPGTAQPTEANEGPLRRKLRERLEERRGEGEESENLGQSKRSLDALDFYGTWKLLDALTDAAFHGTNRNYALGNTPEQRFMGVWSDGVPVKPLIATERP